MKLPELKTAAALAGGVVGLAMLANGCYFIDSIGKPLIFAGVIISIASAVYIVLFARAQNTTQVIPDPIESSYV
jgi:predicted tellurium resistance membrane protein TerC